MTIERGRDPSGQLGCDSAHKIAIPGLAGGVGREGSAFLELSDFSTRLGWRGSGNHALNASARIIAWSGLVPLMNPSADFRSAPLAFGKARNLATQDVQPVAQQVGFGVQFPPRIAIASHDAFAHELR